MSSTFTLGVSIAGATSGSFHSVMGGTQRTLNGLNNTTNILQKSQTNVTRAMERYGSISHSVSTRLTRDLSGISRSMEKIEWQKKRMMKWDGLSKGLAAQRQNLTRELMSLGTTSLLVVPAIQAIKGYAGEQSQATAIAQGAGDFSPKFKQHLIAQARKTSMETAQSNTDILGIMNTLTDAQWKQSDIDKVITLIGRTATTYGQDTAVFTETAETLAKTFGYTSNQMQHAFNLLAKGGNTVGFEFPDLAPALGELGQLMEKSGITGDDALKQIMAAAGAARKTMNKGEVMSGMKSWLQSIDKEKLNNRYKTMGVEYERSRADYAKAGYSDFESSVIIAKRYLEAKGGSDFAKKFHALDGQAEAQQALIENFGMGQVFTSPEQIKFLNAMIKGGDAYQKNKTAINNGQDDNYINKNYAEHAKDLSTKFALLRNEIANTYSMLGEQLAPEVSKTMSVMAKYAKTMTNWIKLHPQAVSSIVKVLAGFVAFKAGFLAAKIFITSVVSPFVALAKVTMVAYGKWLMFTGAMKKGGSIYRAGQLISKLTKGVWSLAKVLSGGLLKGLMLAGRAVLFIGRALIMNPISKLTKGVWSLAKVLSGGLVKGLILAGRALVFIGRALVMNPVGLAVMGVAFAAFLIYKYWKPISAFFKRLWTGIKTVSLAVWHGIGRFFSGFFTMQVAVYRCIWGALTGFFSGLWSTIKSLFSGSIGKLSKVIVDWSPVGLFYKCFSGVLSYFGIQLPGSFTEFGKNIIHGFVDGITATFGTVKDKITSIADSVKNTFKGWLGINSPSTVFMGYGGNITEGLAIGIAGKKGLTTEAMKSLSSEIQKQVPAPEIARIGGTGAGTRAAVSGRAANGVKAAGGDIHLTFSPVINAPDGAKAGIRDALRQSLPELEKLLREIVYQQQRRSFTAA